MSPSTLSRGIHKVKEIGLRNAGVSIYRVLQYKWLQTKYGFCDWHLLAPYELRQYKQACVAHINSEYTNLDTVVEVGCGLGEIISRIDANRRFGLDIEKTVLDAARSLYSNVEFIDGSIEAVTSIPVERIDFLILLNWLHNSTEEEIVNAIEKLLEHKQVTYIMVDQVTEQPEHGHKHDFEAILKNFFDLSTALPSSLDKTRRILVFKRRI